MKIAILSPVAWRTPPRHYGPWEQMASNLAEGLVKLGYDVTLFATADSVTSGKLKAVIESGYEENRNQDAKVVECLHISELMEQASQFDLIHNHFDFLPLTYSRLIHTPIVTTIHGFSSSKIISVYRKYNSTSHYVSISDADRSPLLTYAATIHNGLNIDAFTSVESQGSYLLFLGRIHPDKGTLDAIEIATLSGKELIIAGIIQDASYFDLEIRPRLTPRVRFVGEVGPEQRNQLMGGAAALLHPIHFNEPFGLSVAESMLCGTPVIAYRRGAMPELIADGETGFTVSSAQEAAAKVAQLSKLNRAHIRKQAVDRFSTERMVRCYHALYHKILK